jgi:hypothetical protein
MGTEMNGEPASVQGTASRSVWFVLALLVYGANSDELTSQEQR